jgi:hypothetical protein
MMTVRFPNGQAVQYNTAGFCLYRNNGQKALYTSAKKEQWIATVPADCIVENVTASRVYNATGVLPMRVDVTPIDCAEIARHVKRLLDNAARRQKAGK